MNILNENEKGRTLVEMMGVISIISLLSITSIGGYNYLTSKWKISGIEDALLKTILVVEGSQVKTMNAFDRFLAQSMRGTNASSSQIQSCALKTRRNKYCYRITFEDLDSRIISYFEGLEVSQYRTNQDLTDQDNGTLVIEFASSKNLD